jgi:hypothetical protein
MLAHMRSFLARSSFVLLAAAVAACSGNQTMTPALSGPASRQPVPASLVRAHGPDVLRISADDIAFAQTFQSGPRRFTATLLNYTAHQRSVRPASVGYPDDMACAPYGGTCTTMPSSTAYNVYVSPDGKHCLDESCWGTPEEFLKGLAGSSFAGLVTQYTNGKAGGYTYGDSVSVPYTTLKYVHVFYDNDLLRILAAAVKHFGKTGTTAEYHIFTPPGYDVCSTETTSCYSPDNIADFQFCAYHTSEYVPALKTNIVWSVEPWAGAKVVSHGKSYYGCGNSDPSLKPDPASFQASLLAHESFESWSDPVFPPPTYNPLGYVNYDGDEIGDVCAYRFFTTLKFGKNTYNVQDMYSNAVHGCNNS